MATTWTNLRLPSGQQTGGGNNNIAESIFEQLSLEEHPVPEWIVVGAGTGGTSATIGRYLRYNRYNTRLAVVDPENSAFYPAWRDGNAAAATGLPSRIEASAGLGLSPASCRRSSTI